jgi:dihydrolipoamide dehydrogenase
LVEREHLGGICLNWGCIPTKALLHTAEINHLLQHLDEYGFSAENARFDLARWWRARAPSRSGCRPA